MDRETSSSISRPSTALTGCGSNGSTFSSSATLSLSFFSGHTRGWTALLG
jgi:hypothetical protein